MIHNIAIVDDHILIAKAIGGIIENFSQFNVLYECQNGQALIEKLNTPNSLPDIVLLDISMPVMDGFATAEWLTKNYPHIIIMALSMQDDELSVVKMIKAGAKGYLLKNVHPTELEKALDSLILNGSYFPEWAASKVMVSLNNNPTAPLPMLITTREKEFLQYSITEMSYKQIAEKMYCSPRTVESYRDALFEKLDLKSRVGLAVYAIKNGYEIK